MFKLKEFTQSFTQKEIQLGSTKKLKCLVMGSTGAVGSSLASQLLASNAFERVTLLSRRPVNYEGLNKEKLRVEIVEDFDNPNKSLFEGNEIFFCCHGTTRAQAGSAESFQKIDRDYVLKFAQAFKEANSAREKDLHFLIVTSTGPSINSWFLYPKTKAEIELELSKMDFNKLTILRPAFLKGRPGGRFIEDVGAKLIPFFDKLAPLSISCHIDTVAKAMRLLAVGAEYVGEVEKKNVWGHECARKVEIYENADILKLCKEYE